MAHNTLVNDSFDRNFIANYRKTLVDANNNLFVGRATLSVGGLVRLVDNALMGNSRVNRAADPALDSAGGIAHNRVARDITLIAREHLDHRLTACPPAFDAGQPLSSLAQGDLFPQWEFVVDVGAATRSRVGKAMDAGAYEFCAEVPSAMP